MKNTNPKASPTNAWVKLPGPDVGNLSHLTFIHELVVKFVKHTRKNQPELLNEEGCVLQVAALVQDWGEALTGDISWGDKTADHEATEQATFDAHLQNRQNFPARNIQSCMGAALRRA
jgi:hypothetical protein